MGGLAHFRGLGVGLGHYGWGLDSFCEDLDGFGVDLGDFRSFSVNSGLLSVEFLVNWGSFGGFWVNFRSF